MTPRGFTIGLIAGNVITWIGLVMTALYQLDMLGVSHDGGMPEIGPLVPMTAISPEAPRIDGRRNPFDLAGVAWKIRPESPGSAVSSSGDIRGVLQLPGVRAVVTSQGAVKIGEPIAGGKFSDIRGSRVIIEQQGGRQELDLPGDRRTTLESLNRPVVKEEHPLETPRKVTH